MAKKPVRRGKFTLRRVNIVGAISPGALGASAVAISALTNNVTNEIIVTSLDAAWAWIDRAAIDDGCQFGVSHSDYSAAEITECLTAANSIDLGDKIAQEQANRLVREIGIFAADGIFNNGERKRVKLNWRLNEGDNLTGWVRNSSGTVYTTGSGVSANGRIWVKDI